MADDDTGPKKRAPRGKPFEPGNRLSVHHGLFSPSLVSERGAKMHAELKGRFPWLDDADVVSVEILAEAVATHRKCSEYVDDVISGRERAHPRRGAPRTGIEAVPERIWIALERSRKAVMDALAKLAMNPIERARMGKDLGLTRNQFGHVAGGPVLGAQGRRMLIERGRYHPVQPPEEEPDRDE